MLWSCVWAVKGSLLGLIMSHTDTINSAHSNVQWWSCSFHRAASERESVVLAVQWIYCVSFSLCGVARALCVGEQWWTALGLNESVARTPFWTPLNFHSLLKFNYITFLNSFRSHGIQSLVKNSVVVAEACQQPTDSLVIDWLICIGNPSWGNRVIGLIGIYREI